MSYHCNIYAISAIDIREDNVDFRPFKTAIEMTKFTGLSVEGWQARQSAAKWRKKNRVSKNNFLDELVNSLK